MDPTYISSLDKVAGISPEERARLAQVTDLFAFRSNDYYLSLIDWGDPGDPVRRLIVPTPEELEPWGRLDPSSEHLYTPAPGLQHKYRETALLLVSDQCGGFCRYCFRKRLFIDDTREVNKDISGALAYIRDHPEITNVLLTGGDPLILGTPRLREILARLREIEHVRIIRIGTKMPAYNPYRIINDPDLLDAIRSSLGEKSIYIMAQFNPPRSDPCCVPGWRSCRMRGGHHEPDAPDPGINDDPVVLSSFLGRLSFIGVNPYYVFSAGPRPGTGRCGAGGGIIPIFEQARRPARGSRSRRGSLCPMPPGRSRWWG